MRDADLVEDGQLRPNLDSDWKMVQAVHGGDRVPAHRDGDALWSTQVARSSLDITKESPHSAPEPLLPFQLLQDAEEAGLGVKLKPVLKTNALPKLDIRVPGGFFTDRIPPAPKIPLAQEGIFTAEYFRGLHNMVAAPGIRQDG